MNREILFRGKHISDGVWIYGVPVSNPFITCIFKLTDGLSELKGFQVKPETVGRYTGLTDRNGRKIFEGDLIKNSAGEVGRVSWYPEHLAFMIYRKNPPTVFYMAGNDFSEIEVIGNIHDNPELLEGEENV